MSTPKLTRNMAVALVFAGIILSVSVVYAATFWTGTQHLTVPASMEIYQANGSTQIGPAQNNTAQWSYSTATGKFTWSFYVKNVGQTAYTPIITYPVVAGWSFTNTALTSVAAGTSILVTVTATPPDTTPGTTSGTFQISIGA